MWLIKISILKRVRAYGNCRAFINFESKLLTKGFSCVIINNALSNQVKRMGTYPGTWTREGKCVEEERNPGGQGYSGQFLFYSLLCEPGVLPLPLVVEGSRGVSVPIKGRFLNSPL